MLWKGEPMATTGRGKAKKARYRRILWPTDFSPLAKAALPHAVALASITGEELVLLHVLPLVAAYAVPEIPGSLWVRFQRMTRAAAQAKLRQIEKQVQGRSFHTHTVLVEGVPFLQNVRAAKRLRCDLIVLATHGRTGLTHAIMGSVAENVIRRAPCPVLTVRPPRLQRGS
jgi:nucleotide-binding universal stress UspA family protein